uniref:Uncharacterized protein n=1 Tax=Rhizophora mucronata TaxID=61149 RepID=A0A2P2NNG1_RHIMU
MMTTVTDSR